MVATNDFKLTVPNLYYLTDNLDKLFMFFKIIPIFVSTENALGEHSNNQFTLMSLPNATTSGILCEKGRNYF